MPKKRKKIPYSTFRSRKDRYPQRRADDLFEELLYQRPGLGAWDGPAFSPALYAQGATRAAAHVRKLGFLAFDLDGPKLFDKRLWRWVFAPQRPAASVSALELAERLEELALWSEDPLSEVLGRAPWPGIFYSGWSHGWAKLWSWRLLFALKEPLTVGLWRKLWWATFEQLGGRQIGLDPSCSDPGRIFFYPRLSRWAARQGYATPFKAGRIEKRCELMLQKRASCDLPAKRCPLDTSRPKEEQLWELLSRIEADCSYPEWFRVAAALHHHFGGSSCGYELFDAWSSRGSLKYKGQADTSRLWQALGHYGGRPVTLGTLWYLAGKL